MNRDGGGCSEEMTSRQTQEIVEAVLLIGLGDGLGQSMDGREMPVIFPKFLA